MHTSTRIVLSASTRFYGIRHAIVLEYCTGTRSTMYLEHEDLLYSEPDRNHIYDWIVNIYVINVTCFNC
jgi:hypothetical protein